MTKMELEMNTNLDKKENELRSKTANELAEATVVAWSNDEEDALPIVDARVEKPAYSLSRDGLLRRGEEIVTISRCFPWSEPTKWLSIRGAEEAERELIEDVDHLESGSAFAIRQAIGEAAFVMKISRIKEVEEQFELRIWTVELVAAENEASLVRMSKISADGAVQADMPNTPMSPIVLSRRFHTKLNAWPRELPGGGVLIQDVVNDFYLVGDLQKLDSHSQKLLYSFLD